LNSRGGPCPEDPEPKGVSVQALDKTPELLKQQMFQKKKKCRTDSS
jgi:hypothetical protein